MEPPIEPKLEDCCNSGCSPCIFDIYEQQLKLYKIGKESSEETEYGIFQLKYTRFIIVGTTIVSDSQKILHFKRHDKNNNKVWWKPGHHFLYKYVSDSLSCTRAYTPLNLKLDQSGIDFSIVVKCYSDGLVSKHLFKLEEGELTLWRGPYGSYKMQPNTYGRIIMIAQGTGIAPFITIIESILNNDNDFTKIHLFYCCHSIDEILFRDQLRSYSCYWNFSYEIFITDITSNVHIRYQEPLSTQRFSYEDLNKLKPYCNNQFLICGSSKFMEFYSNVLEENSVQNIILF